MKNVDRFLRTYEDLSFRGKVIFYNFGIAGLQNLVNEYSVASFKIKSDPSLEHLSIKGVDKSLRLMALDTNTTESYVYNYEGCWTHFNSKVVASIGDIISIYDKLNIKDLTQEEIHKISNNISSPASLPELIKESVNFSLETEDYRLGVLKTLEKVIPIIEKSDKQLQLTRTKLEIISQSFEDFKKDLSISFKDLQKPKEYSGLKAHSEIDDEVYEIISEPDVFNRVSCKHPSYPLAISLSLKDLYIDDKGEE